MEEQHKSRVLDMTNGNALKLLLQFALPLFFGNLLQQFYNLADTALAGHILGDGALAQIGATAALYSLITNFAFGLNNGLALTVSRHFGADNAEKLKQSVCWMLILSAAFAALLTVSFLVFRHSLLTVLQVPEGVRQGALSYLTIILAGIPLTMAYNLEASLLQAIGNSMTPLLLLLFSSILNICLDALLMGTFMMGVRGAAVATIFSQAVSAVLGGIYICKNYTWLRFGRKDCKAPARFVSQMLGTGLSMALMSAIYNIGSVVLQSSINALGEIYIAAQVGARRLAEVVHIPGLALGTSAATYTSQNFGAGKRRRIIKGTGTALLLFGIWWIVALIFTFTVAEDAIRLITGSDNQEVIRGAELYLKISIPLIPPMAVLIILRNVLQGMGHLIIPLICSALELAGKIVFACLLVPVYGYFAVCICEPVTWVICVSFIIIGTFLNRKEFRDESAPHEKSLRAPQS